MNCEQAGLHLIAQSDLELSPEVETALGKHLSACCDCRKQARALESITRHLHSWSPPNPGWLYWRRTPWQIVRSLDRPAQRAAYWPAPVFAALSAMGLVLLALNLSLPIEDIDASLLEYDLSSTAAALPEAVLLAILEEAPSMHLAESYIDLAAHELAELPLPRAEWAAQASIELHLHSTEDAGSLP